MLLVVAVSLLGLLGFKGWRLYSLARVCDADLRASEALLVAAPDPALLDRLGAQLTVLRTDSLALRAEAAPFLPLASVLKGLPGVGPDLGVAAPLLEAFTDLSIAADDTLLALAPLVRRDDSSSPLGATLTDRLLAARPQLEQARSSLAQAAVALQRVPHDTLSPSVRDRLQRASAILPLARDLVELTLVAPALLGADGPRDYLIVAQNPDELRATGGFVSGAGVLTLDRGRVVSFAMADSTRADERTTAALPLAPEPFRRYMGRGPSDPILWSFRDFNWSPDFPTAARVAQDLYRRGQQREVSGVIAFTPDFIQLLLSALGPLTVQGTAEPVMAENVVSYMHDSWSDAKAQGRATERKEFLNYLGSAIIARLQTARALDLPALARAVRRGLDERDLLVYLPEARAATLFAERGWDGAVRPVAGDFLMVVSTNLGYNKVNPNIFEQISYALDLSNPAAPLASVTIGHTHRLSGSAACDRRSSPRLALGQRYEEAMVGCYWDYLRVLVPGDSRLVGFATQPAPESWMAPSPSDRGAVYIEPGEGGTRVFSTFLVVPLGGARETVFRYRPATSAVSQDSQGWHYRLKVQKQPGQAQRVTIRILLPPQATLSASSITPTALLNQILSFDLTLDTDQLLEITFQLPA